MSKNPNTPPLFTDQEFTTKMSKVMSMESGMGECCLSCMLCCSCQNLGMVRGVLHGSQPITGSELQATLGMMAGKWKIQPIQMPNNSAYAYTDAFIEGNRLIISGGMHNTTVHSGGDYDDHSMGSSHQVAVANQAQTQYLCLHRRREGGTYIDAFGSVATEISQDRIAIDGCMEGTKMLYMRDLTVTQQPGGSGEVSVAEQIQKLGELKAQGLLTEDEFSAAKAKLIGGY